VALLEGDAAPASWISAVRREARQGTYVMHFAASGEEALELLSGGSSPM
jgi:hypothetical protein